MNIVFTQFTPPFEHGKDEKEYLEYHDWYAELRSRFARKHNVAFISLTKKKKKIEIDWQGYRAIFFPVENPESRQKDGRLFYVNEGICAWLEKFKADVIHIIGTGSEMGLRILEKVRRPKLFLWERCPITKKNFSGRSCSCAITMSTRRIAPWKQPPKRCLETGS